MRRAMDGLSGGSIEKFYREPEPSMFSISWWRREDWSKLTRHGTWLDQCQFLASLNQIRQSRDFPGIRGTSDMFRYISRVLSRLGAGKCGGDSLAQSLRALDFAQEYVCNTGVRRHFVDARKQNYSDFGGYDPH